jgi:ribosomal protein S12 methylthiotransferase accessory factor
MNVTVVGTGPAADTVAAAVDDVGGTVTRGGVDGVAGADVAVVTGLAGAEGFRAANEVALEAGTPWLAVEGGGLGGVPLADLEAAVAGFAPATGCFECLATRVAAGGSEAAEEPTVTAPAARLAGARAGREVVRLAAGEESAALGGVVEVPHATRRVLPVPGCDACGGARDRALAVAGGDRDLDAALAAAERSLDDRVGPVSEVGEAESFPAPYYLARLAGTDRFSDATAAAQAAGVAPGWDEAFMKALGEGLERYCAGVYRADALRSATPGAVEGMVPPSAFVGAEGTDEPIPWVEATTLAAWAEERDPVAGQGAWLPAEFVQFPPPERRFGSPITTGLGLGNSAVGAVLSGLYEVIERDATMLAWYSTFEPLGLAVEDEDYRTLARRARSEGLRATALLVTQDVDVPVVAAAVHREGEWPRFAAGSGADLDPEAAAADALAEALQNWMELRGMGESEAAEEPGAIGRYAGFPAAAREFADPETTVPADSVGPVEVPDGEAELAAVVDRVTAAGLSPYAARTTTRDVASLGFEGVRVALPAAQPLFTDEATFGQRAREVPAELGFEPRLEREHHPYP